MTILFNFLHGTANVGGDNSLLSADFAWKNGLGEGRGPFSPCGDILNSYGTLVFLKGHSSAVV